MGKYLDIARKLEEQKAESLGRYAENPESATLEPVESGIEFVSLLTDTERRYYLGLLEIMQSPKFGMDLKMAERVPNISNTNPPVLCGFESHRYAQISLVCRLT